MGSKVHRLFSTVDSEIFAWPLFRDFFISELFKRASI